MQEAPCLLQLLALGQRRVDDENTKPLAAPSVMKSSEKGETTEKTTKRSNDEGTTPVATRIVMKGLAKDSTTKTTTKSTMSMTTLAKNAGAADGGDGSKARLMTIVLPTMRNLKTQEAP